MAVAPPGPVLDGAVPALLPTLGTTLGAIEVGVMLAAILYGVTTLQTYIYWQTPKKDKRWLRCLVASVWICETAHQATIFVLLYDYTVTNYGKPLFLLQIPWSLSISVLLYGLSGAAVQAFFAYRVSVLSQSIWLAIPAWLLSLARCGTVVAITVTSLKADQNIFEFGKQYSPLVATSLILSAVVDWWNMVFLCYYLAKRRPTFKETVKIVNRMMLFSIETGLITSLVAVSTISCYYAMPLNHIWLGLVMVYAKLYSNAFLVSLNIRTQAERNLASSTAHTTGSQNSGVRSGTGVGANIELARLQRYPSGGLKVNMQHDTYIQMDPDDNVLDIKPSHRS